MNKKKILHYANVLAGIANLTVIGAAIGYGICFYHDPEAATRPVKESLTELFFKSGAIPLPDCDKETATGLQVNGKSYTLSCAPR
jgi:hypothetical protein